MQLKATIFLLSFAWSLSGQTQHYSHSTVWMHGGVTAPLSKSKNWETNIDYIHRLQNEIGSKNPLAHASLAQLRFWENYKHGNWLFQICPFSYIKSTTYLGKLSDYNIKPNTEYRFAASAEVKQTFGKLTLKERGQYEYRLLKTLNYDRTARARARFFAQYAVTEKTKFTFYEEYWFNVPPNKLPNQFDQNWILLTVGRQLTKKFGMDIGYRRNLKERSSLTEFDDDNGLEVAANLKF
jgi:hypothetical protein